jgi:hypothetical protein
VPLQHRRHFHAGDLVRLVGDEMDELDVGLQEREVHGKRRLILLPPERRLEPRMAAVDAHAVAGNVRGREERQPHDVVPVHVGHEDVIGLRRLRAVPRDRGLPERARAAPQVADDVFRLARLDLDARPCARRTVPTSAKARPST